MSPSNRCSSRVADEERTPLFGQFDENDGAVIKKSLDYIRDQTSSPIHSQRYTNSNPTLDDGIRKALSKENIWPELLEHHLIISASPTRAASRHHRQHSNSCPDLLTPANFCGTTPSTSQEESKVLIFTFLSA